MCIDIKKILVPGIVAGIVILIISYIVDYIVQMFWAYDVMTLGGMRAASDPLMMYFFASYFIIGLAMAIVYDVVGKSIKVKCLINKGMKFGFLMWLVAGLVTGYMCYTSMAYPIGFTIQSVIGSLLYSLGAGITIAKLMK